MVDNISTNVNKTKIHPFSSQPFEHKKENYT